MGGGAWSWGAPGRHGHECRGDEFCALRCASARCVYLVVATVGFGFGSFGRGSKRSREKEKGARGGTEKREEVGGGSRTLSDRPWRGRKEKRGSRKMGCRDEKGRKKRRCVEAKRYERQEGRQGGREREHAGSAASNCSMGESAGGSRKTTQSPIHADGIQTKSNGSRKRRESEGTLGGILGRSGNVHRKRGLKKREVTRRQRGKTGGKKKETSLFLPSSPFVCRCVYSSLPPLLLAACLVAPSAMSLRSSSMQSFRNRSLRSGTFVFWTSFPSGPSL